MILTIKKRNKRNKIKYAIKALKCEMGDRELKVLTVHNKVKIFDRKELEVCDVEILHKI